MKIVNKIENFLNEKIEFRDYQDIYNWLSKYQREVINVKPMLKYAGMIGELIENKKYSLYRGMLFRNEKNYRDYYDLSLIKKNKKVIDKKGIFTSWSKDINVAVHFAYGNTTWLDNKKQFNQVDKLFNKWVGIIYEI
ncbi:MAG: hypothetical protein ACOC56_01775 [Atribacterota bacterium]